MCTPRPVGQGSQDGQDSEDDLDLFDAWDMTSLVAGASIPSPIPSRHLAFQMLSYFYNGFSNDFFGQVTWLGFLEIPRKPQPEQFWGQLSGCVRKLGPHCVVTWQKGRVRQLLEHRKMLKSVASNHADSVASFTFWMFLMPCCLVITCLVFTS